MVAAARKLASASAWGVLIRFLNRKNPAPQVQRVIDLLECLSQADTRRRLHGADWKALQLDMDYRRLWRRCADKLLRYSWTPALTSLDSLQPVPVWDVAIARELAASSGETSLLGTIHGPTPQDATEWEQKAVWYILNRGHWERYRHCRECGEWFYANTDFQANCTIACRQKFNARNERFKAKRRDYMQKYRKEEQERTERAKKSARRTR